MPNNANALVLAPESEIDRSVPTDFPLQALSGRVVVAMHPTDHIGEIHLPKIGSFGSGKLGARIGTVWSAGAPDWDAKGNSIEVEPQPGDVAILRTWGPDGIRGFLMDAGSDLGGYKLDKQIRIYGWKDYWFEEIPAQLLPGDEIAPYYDWCLIERDKVSSTIELAGDHWAKTGRVLRAGPLADELVGRRVQYLDEATTAEHKPLIFERGGEKSWILIRAHKCLLEI